MCIPNSTEKREIVAWPNTRSFASEGSSNVTARMCSHNRRERSTPPSEQVAAALDDLKPYREATFATKPAGVACLGCPVPPEPIPPTMCSCPDRVLVSVGRQTAGPAEAQRVANTDGGNRRENQRKFPVSLYEAHAKRQRKGQVGDYGC